MGPEDIRSLENSLLSASRRTKSLRAFVEEDKHDFIIRLGIVFSGKPIYISVFLKPNPIYICISKCQTDESDTI